MLCLRYVGKFTELCWWYGVTCTQGNCSADTVVVCRAYARPHDIVYNTTKIVCMLVRKKQSQGQYPTRVRLGNKELSFIEEFRYLGHVMTADCWDDKILKNNSWGKLLFWICWSVSSHLHLLRQKFNCSSHIVTPFMDVLFGVIHTRTLIENLLSDLVTHASILLTSPDTPALVWHLRWTQLTISMFCSANLLTAWWVE